MEDSDKPDNPFLKVAWIAFAICLSAALAAHYLNQRHRAERALAGQIERSVPAQTK